MTLTRVALLDRSVEIPQGGPRFLKEATKETRERLKDLGLEPNFTRIFSASIVNLSGTELAGLKLINPLEIVISIYGIGVVSTRLKAVVKQVGSLEEFASGWSSLVKCSVDTMDGLLEAEQLTPSFSGLESLNIDLREASTLVKSRRFSFVHIVRGRPLEELPSDFLYSLTEPLFDRPISQTFALTHSKRLEGKVEGDEYFATPSGVVARLALEDSRRTNIRGTRKLLRRYVYAAIDYALALEAAVGNAGRIRSPETLRSVMLYL
ncbi:MAG: hypothetical protein QI223_06960 [Candidatus Korarchaeota archaeon]|nr:hypothetical protein [Candidatus Korarchaeota archaeon]